ncbi:hypothetical protein [Nonomuraea sp. NPDC050310]|uniref:hypothetical protein n=1 Tax=Nonomuraea sp. NPDC050310 TaxID=3154935 RepID=UPI0033D4C098
MRISLVIVAPALTLGALLALSACRAPSSPPSLPAAHEAAAQSRPAPAPTSPAHPGAPVTVYGSGTQRTLPFVLQGDYRASVTYSRNAQKSGRPTSMIMVLVPRDGGRSLRSELIAVVDDEGSAITYVRGAQGSYYLDVIAEGSWKVTFILR